MDSTIKTPKVTVLMPVYNGQKYLREAIESILNQDFTDFEFLIINDGSTDDSGKIIESFNDPRIHIINNEKNLGLVNTLNNAMDLAKGEYIVRMDCDDVSIRNRLAVQVKFMDHNKNIGASGSYYYLIRNNKKTVVDFPLNEKEIECFLVFNSPIPHPTAIIRRSIIQKHNLHYSSEHIHAEDYYFWAQIAEHSQLANISEVLLNYRVHSNQITGNIDLASKKAISVAAIRAQYLKKLYITPSSGELLIHTIISNGLAPANTEQLKDAEKWLQKLLIANDKNKIFHTTYFQKIILERWLRLCINFSGSKKGIQYFLKSEIYKMIKLPLKMKADLIRNLYNSWKRKTNK